MNIVINEINYNSIDDYDAKDWIEIYNNGRKTVDLSAWEIADSDVHNGFVFPEGTMIYPEGYLVVCTNLSKFKAVYNNNINTIGDFQFGLSSSGDFISLTDADNNLIDQVIYETKQPWPVVPLTNGASIELKNPNWDNGLAGSWSSSCASGTPGFVNATITSNNILAQQSLGASCFPTNFTDYSTLRFHADAGADYSIQVFSSHGKLMEMVNGKTENEGKNYINLFTDQNQYKKGVYLIKVKTKIGNETIKVTKR